MKFKITYHTGLVEEVEHGAGTTEQFVNEKFGSAYDAFVENGGTIEVVDAATGEATAATGGATTETGSGEAEIDFSSLDDEQK